MTGSRKSDNDQLWHIEFEKELMEIKRVIAFSPKTEEYFRVDTVKSRKDRYKITTLFSIVGYNIFTVVDYILIEDIADIATYVHFILVTPFLLLASYLFGRNIKPQSVEILATLIPATMAIQVLIFARISNSMYVDHYQYFLLFVAMYANTVLRLRLRAALAVSTLIVLSHGVVMAYHPNVGSVVATTATGLLLSVCIITLISNAFLEIDQRIGWLKRKKSELRAAQLAKDNAKLSTLSRIDPLTGVANRRGLDLAIGAMAEGMQLADTLFCVIMIDVDKFKKYNDNYGHSEGDQCLRTVASTIGACVRDEQDIVARFGGEEFVIFLPQTRLSDGIAVAERIRRGVAAAGIIHGHSDVAGVITVSVGVAEGMFADPTSFNETVASADAALYEAKNTGRNRVVPPGRRRSIAAGIADQEDEAA